LAGWPVSSPFGHHADVCLLPAHILIDVQTVREKSSTGHAMNTRIRLIRIALTLLALATFNLQLSTACSLN